MQIIDANKQTIQCNTINHRHNSDPEKSLVINVEYNQLDPLLKTQGDCKGDVPDDSGFSPYPGNANNIVINIDAYAKTLRGEDQGVVVEFVNPKYKDETRTEFKKATRLECMMQDIPKLFQKELGSDVNIGFTTFDRWFTFSPAKVCFLCTMYYVRCIFITSVFVEINLT
jgi:UDP-sugar pyrophosphorylase